MKHYYAHKVIYLLLIVFILSCSTIDEKPNSSDLAGTYHSVKPGDTLSKLADKYHLSVEEIMETNGIDNERSLQIGQALFMPDPDPIGKKIATLKKATNKKSEKPTSRTSPNSSKHNERIFVFPVPHGSILHRFSKAKDKPYDGIGIKAPRGTKAIAALDGQVLFVGNDGTKFGLLVILEHKEPYITIYAHLDRAEVKTGQHVKQGQSLGAVGTSGGILTPHLHFQIRVNRRPQDPLLFIKGL